jgi:hypothetical protein
MNVRIRKTFRDPSGNPYNRKNVFLTDSSNGLPIRIYHADGTLLDSIGKCRTTVDGRIDVWIPQSYYEISLSVRDPKGSQQLLFLRLTLSDLISGDSSGSGTSSGSGLSSPVFTYHPSGKLATITYADGTVKTFSYSGDLLSTVDTDRAGLTTRKTLHYTSGVLQSITESTLP